MSGMRVFGKLLTTLWAYRRIIALITLVELKKRHAGSALGPLWIVLYPALLLSMYLFVYMAVFKVRVTGIDSSFEYALFVFSGIIPYLGFSEVLNGSSMLLAQNRHLISNVIVPAETLPVRLVCMALVSQGVSLALYMGLLLWAWLWVAPMLGLEFFFLAGLAWFFFRSGRTAQGFGAAYGHTHPVSALCLARGLHAGDGAGKPAFRALAQPRPLPDGYLPRPAVLWPSAFAGDAAHLCSTLPGCVLPGRNVVQKNR